ncbi:hypothetical protein [Tannerella forsythia]|uniref:hypothetical protein n=1 Tax=Tannerella forsythia TaxID=28112 RepID=UPI000A4474B6|nr:hypothetical protein [Tannerella forsythia]
MKTVSLAGSRIFAAELDVDRFVWLATTGKNAKKEGSSLSFSHAIPSQSSVRNPCFT